MTNMTNVGYSRAVINNINFWYNSIWMLVNKKMYNSYYKNFGVNGRLYNHESTRRVFERLPFICRIIFNLMIESLEFRRVGDFAYITELFMKAYNQYIDVYLACSNLERITQLKKRKINTSISSKTSKKRRLN